MWAMQHAQDNDNGSRLGGIPSYLSDILLGCLKHENTQVIMNKKEKNSSNRKHYTLYFKNVHFNSDSGF